MMYRMGDFLSGIRLHADEKEKTVRLKDIVPIGKIHYQGADCEVLISVDGKDFHKVKDNADGKTAAFLKVKSDGECSVMFFVGPGYWAERDSTFTRSMKRDSGWTGGDGINSFNLSDGKDSYGNTGADTMFIYGDTFVCEVDQATNARIQPVHMPNNTYSIMKNGDPSTMEFFVPKDENGEYQSLFTPQDRSRGQWFWLQDGIVLGDKFYLSPLCMLQDLSREEGFQFEIDSIAMLEMDIVNHRVDFSTSKETKTGLYARQNGKQWIGGMSYMPFTKEAGYENGDGYIYAYGYRSSVEQINICSLFVARVQPNDFKHTDKWEFFTENGFEATDIKNAKLLLDHVSTEMSVSPIMSGHNKGKFLAVFQYDVQSNYTAYAIGENPWGPFGEIQKVYYCDENQRVDETAYMYNAKAHPHLSHTNRILVSYNVNTPIMDENWRLSDIYRPRFILLCDTTE